jgi:hypothetical protein
MTVYDHIIFKSILSEFIWKDSRQHDFVTLDYWQNFDGSLPNIDKERIAFVL